MTHRYQLGQSVRLRTGIRTRAAAAGDYKILRQLPDNGEKPSTASRAAARHMSASQMKATWNRVSEAAASVQIRRGSDVRIALKHYL